MRAACAVLLVCGPLRAELRVRCEPERLVRGEQVACSARVEPARPFVLVARRALAGGHRLDDPSEQRFETGGEARWAGVAVRDTRVEFIAHSAGVELRGAAGFTVESSELTMVPKTTVEVEDENTAKKILRLMDALEENDDVQEVYSNFDIPERVLETVAG